MQSDLAAALASRRQSMKKQIEAEAQADEEASSSFSSSHASSEPVVVLPEAVTRTDAHVPEARNLYRALYDYHGEAHDTDIALRKGDIVNVLDDSGAGWWRARVGDIEGLVPANFLGAISEDDDDDDESDNKNNQQEVPVMGTQESNDDGWGDDDDSDDNNDDYQKELTTSKPFVHDTNENLWGSDEEAEDEEEEDDEKTTPVCTEFALDMRAASFGTCMCGLPKKEHTVEALASGVAAPVQHGTYGTGAGKKQSSPPSNFSNSSSSTDTKTTHTAKVVHIAKPMTPATPPALPPSSRRLPQASASPRSNFPAVAAANKQNKKQQDDEEEATDDDDTVAAGVCDEFKLDMLAASFGMCKCGHGRCEHSEKARLITTVPSRPSPSHSHSHSNSPSDCHASSAPSPSSTRVSRQPHSLPSPARKAPVVPPPPPPASAVAAVTSTTTVANPRKPNHVISPAVVAHDTFEHDVECPSFVLDVNAASFGMCKCGHKRSEHSSEALLNTTVTGSGTRHVVHKSPSPTSTVSSSSPSSSPPLSPKFNVSGAPVSKIAVPPQAKASTPPPVPQVSSEAQSVARAATIAAIANRARRLDSERPPKIETPQKMTTLLLALHEFVGAEEGDLSLNVGDEIELIEKVDEGWWKGKRGQEEGIFPAQFVEEISAVAAASDGITNKEHSPTRVTPPPPPPQPEAPPALPISPKPNLADHLGPTDNNNNNSNNVSRTKQTAKPFPPPPTSIAADPTDDDTTTTSAGTGRYVKAIYDYSSDQPEDLQFRKGDVIQVMYAVDDHWLNGKLNDTVGIFPNQFVQDTPAPSPTSSSTSTSPRMRQSTAPPPPQPRQQQQQPPATVSPKTVSAVTALFDFAGGEPGDLSFKEGQQIEVLEEVDEGWLKGRLLGSNTSGIFPRSFVNAPTTVVQTASYSPTGKGCVNVPPPPLHQQQQQSQPAKSMDVQYMPLADGLVAGVSHTTLQRPYTKGNSAPPAPWYNEGRDTFSSTSRYASFGVGPTTKTEEFKINRSKDRSLVLLTIAQNSNEQVAKITSDVRPCRVLTHQELQQSAEQYGPQIVAFAELRLGEVVGNGECWTLADEALKSVSGVSPALGSAFGQPVSVSEAMPGDIIQLRECKFVLPNGGRQTAGMPDHTAVVKCKTGPASMEVLEQNPNPVSKGSYDFNTLVSGTFVIYRVYPQARMPSADK